MRLYLNRRLLYQTQHLGRNNIIPKIASTRFGLRNSHNIAKNDSSAPEIETISLDFAPVERAPLLINADLHAKTTPEKSQTPMVLRQVREFIDKYPGHVVLTQVGSFYELYFEQATLYAGLLNLTLTSKKYACGMIPFAGFPYYQLSKYIKILVKEYGYSVVIVDQYKKTVKDLSNSSDGIEKSESGLDESSAKLSDSSNGLKVVRRVSRIVTPGTLLDEAFENLTSSTYLLNIEFPENCFSKLPPLDMKLGISWTDISTGEIYVQKLYLKELVAAITRIRPSEILLDSNLVKHNIESGEWFPELVELKKYFISYYLKPSKHRTFETFQHLFSINEYKKYSLFTSNLDMWEGVALRNLLTYIEDHLPEYSTNLQVPERKVSEDIMQIDSRTSTALELHSTIRNNSVRGSLLSAIRRTVTTSGTRLLTQWISAPLLNITEIDKRHSMVAFLHSNYSTITTPLIETYLKKIYDITKILQKFSMNKGHYTELLQLSHSLNTTKNLKTFLTSQVIPKCDNPQYFHEVIESIQINEKLVNKILTSIDEEKVSIFMDKVEEASSINMKSDKSNSSYQSMSQTKLTNNELFSPDWCIRSKASRRLGALHKEYAQLVQDYQTLQARLEDKFIKKLGFKNVEMKISLSSGLVVQISGPATSWRNITNIEKIIPGLEYIQGKSSKKLFRYDAWIKLGYDIQQVILRIREEEEAIIESFKTKFIEDSYMLRKTAATLDYLDVLSSFAKLALEKNLTRPIMDNSTDLDIKQGVHVVVEDGLLNTSIKRFVPNDCTLLQSMDNKTWVITGPNMGGKSTFLRQNAIIVILAQMGSFVPCEYSRIGIVDKIFSRVGSADDLYNELSTFMVEMIETNYILQGATERSLAILDEVGRGTNGHEGIAIAYGTLKHLITENKCKTLFATHFGKELEKMMVADNTQGVSFYKTDLVDTVGPDGNFSFSRAKYDHKLKPGVCMKSDALKVAYEAGFPKLALQYADAALKSNSL